jgi:hypothetical protein
MGICIFKTQDLKRVINHALQSKDWSMPWSHEKPQPAILLVHDQGVYCMSNGIPRDRVEEKSNFCVYAKGCDPRTDEDFYDESQYLVGGDDFVEILPVSQETLQLCDQFGEVEITVTSNKLSMTFTNPRLKKVV